MLWKARDRRRIGGMRVAAGQTASRMVWEAQPSARPSILLRPGKEKEGWHPASQLNTHLTQQSWLLSSART